MGFFQTLELGSGGLVPKTVDVVMHVVNTAQATANVVKGAVMQVDIKRTSAETTTSKPGVVGSVWMNLVSPLSDQLDTGFFLVALGAVTKGANGLFRLQGYAECLMSNNTATDVPVGNLCTPVTAVHYLESGTQVGGDKQIFLLDEAALAADAGTTLRKGWFDGT